MRTNLSTTIYAVCDPLTHEVRYVGKTVKAVRKRINEHINGKLQHRAARWFRKVKTPEYFTLEIIPSDQDWASAECFWIAYLRGLGANLLNATTGGEGVSGLVRSAENRARMVVVSTSKKASFTTRAKISAALLGRPVSLETRKRLQKQSAEKYQIAVLKLLYVSYIILMVLLFLLRNY